MQLSQAKKNQMLRKTLLTAIAALSLGSTAMVKHGGAHRSSAYGGSVYGGGGYGGINGSAYLVGGFGMTALTGNNIVVVPIRSGVGLRLGANLGYLKFTDSPTWNPF